MIEAAMLAMIEGAGEGILVLIDGLEDTEFLRSRITRAEVRRQLRTLGQTLAGLPAEAHQAMPELDVAGWQAVLQALDDNGPAGDEAAWQAARERVPATLSWLRVYKRNEPALFSFRF